MNFITYSLSHINLRNLPQRVFAKNCRLFWKTGFFDLRRERWCARMDGKPRARRKGPAPRRVSAEERAITQLRSDLRLEVGATGKNVRVGHASLVRALGLLSRPCHLRARRAMLHAVRWMERIGDANDKGNIDVFSSERMEEDSAVVLASGGAWFEPWIMMVRTFDELLNVVKKEEASGQAVVNVEVQLARTRLANFEERVRAYGSIFMVRLQPGEQEEEYNFPERFSRPLESTTIWPPLAEERKCEDDLEQRKCEEAQGYACWRHNRGHRVLHVAVGKGRGGRGGWFATWVHPRV